MIEVPVKNSISPKTPKRNKKKHSSNYYIVIRRVERRRTRYLKNLITEILKVIIWISKNRILSRKERREARETQKITSEASASPISLKICIIKTAPFAQLAKNLKVDLFTATMTDIEKALKKKPYSNPATLLPEKYQDFLDMFSREEVDKLPLHRLNDHKIDIMPEKKPNFGSIYGMSQNELKVLKKYLNDNLIKGFIRPSHSPTASPILFARKPGEDLHLCVDYRALNAITIKNKYSLSLIQKTLTRIYKVKIYTTLNIIATFNKLRITKGEK